MKKLHSTFVILVAMALLTLSVPVQASTDDSRIESSARKSYLFKTYLSGDDIKIESVDGDVVLTGSVEESSHKALAQETVAGLPGVKSVDNRLEVKGESITANSDAWLRDKIRFTLLVHKSVSFSATEINVNDGIVTLSGEATSEAQKELTTEYVEDIKGVKEVNNEMTVSETSKPMQTISTEIDDASITAQVKTALLYHRSTSALNTSVSTNNGLVTLEGEASNSAEVDLVTKLASDINGVQSVNNQMIIR